MAHSFANSPDGAFLYAGLAEDGAGNFYGATVMVADGEGVQLLSVYIIIAVLFFFLPALHPV